MNKKQVAQNHILHAIDVRIDEKKMQLNGINSEVGQDLAYLAATIDEMQKYRNLIAGLFQFLGKGA